MEDINISKDFLRLDTHRDFSKDVQINKSYENEHSVFQYMEHTKFNGAPFDKPANLYCAIEQHTSRCEVNKNYTKYYDKNNNLIGDSLLTNKGATALINYLEYGSYEDSGHGTMNEVTDYRGFGLSDTSEQALYTATSEDGLYTMQLLDYDGDNVPDSITQTDKRYNITHQKSSVLSEEDKLQLQSSIENKKVYKPRTDKFSYTVEDTDNKCKEEYVDLNNDGKLDLYNLTYKYENGNDRFVQQRQDNLVASKWFREDGTLEKEEYTASNKDGSTSEYCIKNYDEKGKITSSQLSKYTLNQDGTTVENTKYLNEDKTTGEESKYYDKDGNLINSETLVYSTSGNLISKVKVFLNQNNKYLYTIEEYDEKGKALRKEISALDY